MKRRSTHPRLSRPYRRTTRPSRRAPVRTYDFYGLLSKAEEEPAQEPRDEVLWDGHRWIVDTGGLTPA
jgi:hypothetical protein